MVRIENLSRRGFIQGIAGAGAFVLGVQLLPRELLAAPVVAYPSAKMNASAFQPSIYLAIDKDGTSYIISHRSEMGNGVRTALPRIVADELDADWARVKVVQGLGDVRYGDQDTDGSHSVRSFLTPLREAGASARLMLVRAAAEQWNVPESECTTQPNFVVHAKSGRKLGYGALAASAAKLDVPKKEDIKLKPRSEWRYIGKRAKGYDLKPIVTGQAVFGQDTQMDGMLYANVLHPPVMGSTVNSIDDKAAKAVAGVRQIETIDTYKGSVGYGALGGVAVLGDNSWAVMQGKKSLKVDWNLSEHASFTSTDYRKDLESAVAKPGKVVREIGNVDAEFAKGGKVVEASYYAPLIAHAPMEPPAALAVYNDGKVELWACSQNPQGVQDAVAQALGIKKEDVTVHVTFLGGGFGRKSFPDFAVEASVLSKKTGKPVKVVWSREDDVQFDVYHAVSAHYLKATLGSDGKPTAWLQRVANPPIGSLFNNATEYCDPGELGLGCSDLPYAIPNIRTENGPAKAHVRIGWFRSVANVYNAYAVQSFTDECAAAAGKDPVEYVLSLLGPDRIIPRSELPKDYGDYGADYDQYPIDVARFRRVIETVATQSGWAKKKAGNGVGWGFAAHRSFLTYVASVVQLHLDDAGHVKVDRIDTALDAGTIVNPAMIENQFQGAAVMGLTTAFFGEITATKGAINQSNFLDYPMARIGDAPREIHVYIAESDAPPGGVGEPGLPAIAPAICNAIYSASGKRVRELPLVKSGLVRSGV